MSEIKDAKVDADKRRGRGAVSNQSSRYDRLSRVGFDDGWEPSDDAPAPLKTTLAKDTSRSVIAKNDSPDIYFEQSINPYRGCEHGCIYCYARPTHAYLGLSPGLDFESRLTYKPDAAKLLAAELAKPSYRCKFIALGTNTDPYQPVEREYRITREILEVLAACDHPVAITTKSALVARDIDILGPMARKGLAQVAVSVTTLDRKLARRMEPRASTPERRLEAIAALAEAGIPTAVLTSPMIPSLNDHELETILDRAAGAGATLASYIPLRLPNEIADLFREWLEQNEPGRAKRILKLVREMRGGKLNDARFGHRMRGEGVYADMIAKRFAAAVERFGLNRDPRPELVTGLFRKPQAVAEPAKAPTPQLSLF